MLKSKVKNGHTALRRLNPSVIYVSKKTWSCEADKHFDQSHRLNRSGQPSVKIHLCVMLPHNSCHFSCMPVWRWRFNYSLLGFNMNFPFEKLSLLCREIWTQVSRMEQCRLHDTVKVIIDAGGGGGIYTSYAVSLIQHNIPPRVW